MNDKNSGPQIISVRTVTVGGKGGLSYREVLTINNVWFTVEDYQDLYWFPAT